MNRPTRPLLVVAANALSVAEAAARRSAPTETGGLLLGVRLGGDVVVVDIVEVADEHATHNRFSMEQKAGDLALRAYLTGQPADCPFGYVGTWHSHPAPSETSRKDRTTLRTEAVGAPDLVALLVLVMVDGGWRAEGHVAHRRRVLRSRAGRRSLAVCPWISQADVAIRGDRG